MHDQPRCQLCTRVSLEWRVHGGLRVCPRCQRDPEHAVERGAGWRVAHEGHIQAPDGIIHPLTRHTLRFSPQRRLPVQATLTREGLGFKARKLLGLEEELQVGALEFDWLIQVETDTPEATRALFSNADVRQAVLALITDDDRAISIEPDGVTLRALTEGRLSRSVSLDVAVLTRHVADFAEGWAEE